MYGDFATMVDAMIGRVLKALEETKMTNDTMVVFTSDNGPVWYEADVQRFGHDASGGLRGMKADAWEAGHRMPLGLVRGDSQNRAGSNRSLANHLANSTTCKPDRGETRNLYSEHPEIVSQLVQQQTKITESGRSR